jgi:hypothetical protein
VRIIDFSTAFLGRANTTRSGDKRIGNIRRLPLS